LAGMSLHPITVQKRESKNGNQNVSVKEKGEKHSFSIKPKKGNCQTTNTLTNI